MNEKFTKYSIISARDTLSWLIIDVFCPFEYLEVLKERLGSLLEYL